MASFTYVRTLVILILTPFIVFIRNNAPFQQSLEEISKIKTNISTTAVINTYTSIASTNVNINLFLSSYQNKSQIINIIREIESNIIFTNVSSSDFNALYSTGYSPHYYNGMYSLEKTPKHIRFPYLCRPEAVNEISTWTLKLNETLLSSAAKTFLSGIQQYGFYANLHQFYLENLKQRASPYMNPINVMYLGNSHCKQLHEAMFGLIDSSNMNSDHIINKYIPIILAINKSEPINLTYSSVRCNDWVYQGKHEWPGSNLFSFNKTMLKKIESDQINHNLFDCNNNAVYTFFNDNSNDTYIMMHDEANKTFKYYYTTKLFSKLNHTENHLFQNENENDIEMIEYQFKNLDILVFNVGNIPFYDVTNQLETDLKLLNMENKSVVFMSNWNMDGRNKLDPYQPHELYQKYHNIIILNWVQRLNEAERYKLKVKSTTSHYCMPGIPDHALLSVTNLINLLTFVDNIY